MTEWLDTYNQWDAEAFRQFTQKHTSLSAQARRPVAELVAQMAVERYATGGMTPVRLEQATEQEIAVLVQAKQGEHWLRLTMRVEEAAPEHIASIGFTPASPPPEAATRHQMEWREFAQELDGFIEKRCAADAFSGAVLIAQAGKPILKKACGLANRNTKSPNRTDTKFNLGSMNKMFTGVAIAQLAEAGKLSFTDTVGQHLPAYPNRQVAERVTIHQLLTHTSGLGNYWNQQYLAAKDRICTIDDYLALFAEAPLSFEPGNGWSYSNSGFIVLGAIIERVAGQSYYDYVRKHIYQPAGMTNTDAYEKTSEMPNFAHGYTLAFPQGRFELLEHRDNLAQLPLTGGPAGGGYSTVEDLLKFAVALRDHKLLTPAYTEQMLTAKVPRGPNGGVAYGFGETRINGRRAVGHNGGFAGVSADFLLYRDSGYTMAVLSNYEFPFIAPVIGRIRERLDHLELP